MSPRLEHGDVVLVVPVLRRIPRPGWIVLVRHPVQAALVLAKRVRSRSAAKFSVGSDNPTQGTDSRQFGPLGPEHLIGRVVWTSR